MEDKNPVANNGCTPLSLAKDPFIRNFIQKSMAIASKEEMPRKKQDSPYPVLPTTYGAKAQYPERPDDSPPLDKEGKHFIQRVNGKFLYLGRAVDLTILAAISALADHKHQPSASKRPHVVFAGETCYRTCQR